MQVSVETLKGLERKLSISVPTEKVEEEVSQRLQNLARKVKVDGFRPGKVPMHIVKQRFSDSVYNEVARAMIQSTLYDALQANDLRIAGSPAVELEQLESGKDFKYTATIEVFPEINIVELANDEIEIIRAQVKDDDVTDMLNKLREQNKVWQPVSRAAAKEDKVRIDFEGFIDDKPFSGGKAENYEVIIGSGSMIPGFEDGLIGHNKGEPFDIKVTFPENYGNKELAGKEAIFRIVLHEVFEGTLPPLDDAFAEQFNIKEGVEELRADIKRNMVRELERRVNAMNRERIFDKLLTVNVFELPNALIEEEIGHLKHDMYHRLFGHEHKENEQIPDFPRALFEEQAKRRVHLGLLFSEYVKKHGLVAEQSRVEAMIEKLASAYEHPEELRSWYQSSKERLAEIEALVMEETVAEKISENAKLLEKEMDYDAVMNPARKGETAQVSETEGE